MTDKRQNEQQDELRDLDVPEGAAQEVNRGKVGVQDVWNPRGAGKPYVSANHNETLVRSYVVANHRNPMPMG
jgi:hypothetical protein